MAGRMLGVALSILIVGQLGPLSAGLLVDSRSRGWIENLARREAAKDFDKCVQVYADTLDSNVRSGLGESIRSRTWDVPGTDDRKIAWGTGFGTTATRSLEAAFKAMGLSVWHWDTDPWIKHLVNIMKREPVESCSTKVREELLAMPKVVDAFIDTPSAELFLTAFKMFPNARFFHTDRNATQWAASRLKGHPNTLPPLQEPCAVAWNAQQRNKDFREEELAEMFKAHTELVKCIVPPERLIDIDLLEASEEEKQQTAQRLAGFLNLPEERSISEFPMVKSGEDVDILSRFKPVEVETGKPCSVNLNEVRDQAEDPLLRHLRDQEAHWAHVYDVLNQELLSKHGCRLHL